MITLGRIDQLSALPARLELEGGTFFLTRGAGGFVLLSAVCPHQGGEVELDGAGGFACPVHGWRFDREGCGVNVGSAGLRRIPVCGTTRSC